MNSDLTTQVLIVGAGPTGLMAANQLQRFGIDFVIVDTKSGPTDESRAIAVTARSMELYEQMGLIDEVLDKGVHMIAIDVYLRGRRKMKVKIGEIGKGFTDFAYLHAFEQSRNETLLAENLEKNGNRIYWDHEFIEFIEYQDVIRAKIENRRGTFEVNAEYVIACEGARSPIRHQLNFSFKGGTYNNLFFVADTVLEWNLPYNELLLTPGKENFCAFFALRGERRMRVIGTLPKQYKEDEAVTFDDIADVVVKTSGQNIQFKEVHWFSTYKLHHRGVDHFSEGRVFLAGDSAHIHSPAGGQGMNTGLLDASNLAWKLAMVLKYEADPKLLETYSEERLPFAKWLLKFTDRGFNIMTKTSWISRTLRYLAMTFIAPLVFSIGGLRRFMFRTVSQIGYSYKGQKLSHNESSQRLKFKAGDRVPYLPNGSIYPKLTGACFHLIHVGTEKINPADVDRLKAKYTLPIEVVESELNQDWKKLGIKDELFILARPDNYIGYIADDWDSDSFEKYIQRY